jgi:hypothetical protein
MISTLYNNKDMIISLLKEMKHIIFLAKARMEFI